LFVRSIGLHFDDPVDEVGEEAAYLVILWIIPVFNENDPHWQENILNPPDVILPDESDPYIEIDARDKL
jgi:hypothetical protein